MKRKPSEYLRRFSYDTIGHDDRINQKRDMIRGETAVRRLRL